MDELRDKIAAVLAPWMEDREHLAPEVADSILAIPEIADAIALKRDVHAAALRQELGPPK